jgi:phosphate transport system substrate-binding protein
MDVRFALLLVAAPLVSCAGHVAAQANGVASPKDSSSPTSEEPPAVPGSSPTTTGSSAEKHVLHFHGSNTLGTAAVPKLARAFLEKQGAKEVFVNDESRSKERVWVQARIGEREVSIEIYAPGTKVGFETLERGWCDLVMASRPVTDEEAKKLEGLGDLTSHASENVVGMDGIAVIVNQANPVKTLTTKQLEQVFTGQITTWDKLGGKPGPIHVLSRDEKSGTHDAFVSLVLRGKQPKAEKSFEDSEALSASVAKDEGAIGYVGLPYVKQAKAVAVQELGARPVAPTPFTIATEDYPLARRLFLYTPEKPKDPMVKEFVEFALSDDGQQVMGDAGFIPLTLRSETAQVPTEAPPQYAKLTTGATRLSVSLRFKRKSAALDTKAVRDIDRLVRHLASPINKGRKVALAGFSDDSEGPGDKIAQQRVETVASLLSQKGVKPADVASFGPALPIAPNDLPDGRAKNRRVEIWLH